MISTAFRRGALPLVALVGLALAGCSAGASGSGPAPTSLSGSPKVSTVAPVAAGGDFCGVIKTNIGVVTGASMTKLLTSGKPDDLRAYFAKAQAINEQLYAATPADLQPTVKVLRENSDAVGAAMAKAGYDFKKIDLAAVLKATSSKSEQQSLEKFMAYVKTTCKIDLAKAATTG